MRVHFVRSWEDALLSFECDTKENVESNKVLDKAIT